MYVLQEREQLSSVADKGAKLRLRRQDVIAKQEQLNVLMQNRGKLEAFLGCTGKGESQMQCMQCCCLPCHFVDLAFHGMSL